MSPELEALLSEASTAGKCQLHWHVKKIKDLRKSLARDLIDVQIDRDLRAYIADPASKIPATVSIKPTAAPRQKAKVPVASSSSVPSTSKVTTVAPAVKRKRDGENVDSASKRPSRQAANVAKIKIKSSAKAAAAAGTPPSVQTTPKGTTKVAVASGPHPGIISPEEVSICVTIAPVTKGSLTFPVWKKLEREMKRVQDYPEHCFRIKGRDPGEDRVRLFVATEGAAARLASWVDSVLIDKLKFKVDLDDSLHRVALMLTRATDETAEEVTDAFLARNRLRGNIADFKESQIASKGKQSNNQVNRVIALMVDTEMIDSIVEIAEKAAKQFPNDPMAQRYCYLGPMGMIEALYDVKKVVKLARRKGKN
jgi:hypothetical protein